MHYISLLKVFFLSCVLWKFPLHRSAQTLHLHWMEDPCNDSLVYVETDVLGEAKQVTKLVMTNFSLQEKETAVCKFRFGGVKGISTLTDFPFVSVVCTTFS